MAMTSSLPAEAAAFRRRKATCYGRRKQSCIRIFGHLGQGDKSHTCGQNKPNRDYLDNGV
jgi:hypothetical protein